jgi:hypothetical protein
MNKVNVWIDAEKAEVLQQVSILREAVTGFSKVVGGNPSWEGYNKNNFPDKDSSVFHLLDEIRNGFRTGDAQLGQRIDQFWDAARREREDRAELKTNADAALRLCLELQDKVNALTAGKKKAKK